MKNYLYPKVAIINGDAEQAERCMSEHMDTIERYMEEMQKKF